MMISTKGRYALYVMLKLAKDKSGDYVSIKTISDSEDMPQKYLETIVSMLYKGGLLESKRGKEGGYRLTKAPSEYSVGEILHLTEGSLAPVACLEKGAGKCEKADICDTLPLWIKLDGMINNFLDGISLEDLVNNDI
ncbi:MAG: Rrf2 family transcriptional regulator [Clostridia bacterium]|nr:Rrf2 family transcriptional regulator [Clostridia bacterium]